MSNKKKPYNFRKERTKGTAFMILEELERFQVEDIISYIYHKDNDNFINILIKNIEKRLVLAKVNPEKFKQELHKFFQDTAQEIKAQNKIKKFYEFSHIMLKKLYIYDEKWHIACAYYDTLIQIADYFTGVHEQIIGISKDGSKVFTVPEMHHDIDRIMADAMKNKHKFKTFNEFQEHIIKLYNKNGYKVSSMLDIDQLFTEERCSNNMQFCMTYFIDETCRDIIQKPYGLPINEIYKFSLPKKPTEVYKTYLQSRRRLLPNKGIKLNGYRKDNNIQEIYFKEKYVLDRIYLLYRIKVNDSYLSGYYDTQDCFFYSYFKDSHGDNNKINKHHFLLENYILELYSILTTDIEIEAELDYIEEEESKSQGKIITRKLNRNNLSSIYTEIEPYIRKLPFGAVASDEAILLAKKYGIKLSNDETFVRGFTKQVYKKEAQN